MQNASTRAQTGHTFEGGLEPGGQLAMHVDKFRSHIIQTQLQEAWNESGGASKQICTRPGNMHAQNLQISAEQGGSRTRLVGHCKATVLVKPRFAEHCCQGLPTPRDTGVNSGSVVLNQKEEAFTRPLRHPKIHEIHLRNFRNHLTWGAWLTQ